MTPMRWRLHRAATFVRDSARISRRHGFRSQAGLLARSLHVYRRSGLPPWAALRAGLLGEGIADEVLAAAIGGARLKRLLTRVNPAEYEVLTEDKVVFDAWCTSTGLPVPALYAVFDRPAGRSRDGVVLRTDAQWAAFFADALPPSFVVKPAAGVFGYRVKIYTRTATGFRDERGSSLAPPDLHRDLASDSRFRRFVVQERLVSHPALQQLSGTRFLQTLRLVTYVDDAGHADVYLAELKAIGADSAVDNYCSGTRGNLICGVRLDDGVVISGMRKSADKAGVDVLTRHPRTHRPLEGFQLPFWREALALARDAATRFLPIRSIGWDVALTPTGPVLVEGNIWWDPSNHAVAQHRPRSLENTMAKKLIDLLETAPVTA